MDMGRRQDNRAGKTNRDDLKRFHPVEKQQMCRETQRPLSAVFSAKEFQYHIQRMKQSGQDLDRRKRGGVLMWENTIRQSIRGRESTHNCRGVKENSPD